MTDEKISIADLRKQIARQSGLGEETVGRFLGALIPAITEGLRNGETVRISGFGAFKLVWVEPRKSVNVTTGEPIVIDGYSKIAFTPDSSIKEQLEPPKSVRESAFNPMAKLGEQADEIVDLLGELGQAPFAAKKAEAEAEKPKEPEKQEEQEKPEKPEIPEETVQPAEPEKPQETKKPKETHFWLTAVITLAVLIGMLIGGYYYLTYKIEKWAENLQASADVEQVETPASTTDTIAENASTEDLYQEDIVPASASNDASADACTRTGVLATEKVMAGSRLAQIARRHYGSPYLWVYIYEANRDIISDPNHLPVGMEIIIPSLPDSLADVTRSEVLQRAKKLEETYLR